MREKEKKIVVYSMSNFSIDMDQIRLLLTVVCSFGHHTVKLKKKLKKISVPDNNFNYVKYIFQSSFWKTLNLRERERRLTRIPQNFPSLKCSSQSHYNVVIIKTNYANGHINSEYSVPFLIFFSLK